MHRESPGTCSEHVCLRDDFTVGKGELQADAALAAVELPASQTMRMWSIARDSRCLGDSNEESLSEFNLFFRGIITRVHANKRKCFDVAHTGTSQQRLQKDVQVQRNEEAFLGNYDKHSIFF